MAERHAYFLPDGRFIDFDLPEALRLAIGDAVVAYSRIDNIVLEIIWELRASGLNEKRKLAGRSAAQNFAELKQAISALIPEPLDGIWSSLEQLRDERALIAHGNWMLIDGQQYVLWHKAMLTYKDDVTAELFDDARFDRYMTKSTALWDMLYKFRTTLSP